MDAKHSTIKVIDDFLPLEIIHEMHTHVVSHHDEYSWRPNRIWDPGLVIGSPSIMLMNMGMFSTELFSACSSRVDWIDFSELELPYPVFYDAPVNSYVNWHTEEVPLSISIYLTNEWKREWGGLFLYEEDGNINGIVPSFNRAVISGPHVPHCVTTINPTTQSNRYSLQLFFTERNK